jgi:hypothetical protein
MRGKRAKAIRRIAYDPPVLKYGRNREYEMVKCPGQHRHKMPLTIIADNDRYLYQALKGRRADLSEPDLG